MARVVKRSLSQEQSFMEDFVQGDLNVGSVPTSILPPVNIREDENFFMVEVAAPGYDPDELSTEVSKGILTISAKRKIAGKEKTGLLRKEFQFGAFQRTFRLPAPVAEEKIGILYENGILYISMKKV